MRDRIRTIRLAPYRPGIGPIFTLQIFDTLTERDGKCRLAYVFTMRENGKTIRVFEGDDFYCSPLHAIDSDDAARALLGFLTLRPGDTDREYFDRYTREQLDFCASHAETLSAEVSARFGEG